MTTYRIKKIFNNIKNNRIYFLQDNDIFCNYQLIISNLDFQIFKYFSQNHRIVFIDKTNIKFADQNSYASFYDNDGLNLKGILGNLKLIEFNKDINLFEKIFYSQFIKNLGNFINQDIKTIFIIDSENKDINNMLDLINVNYHNNIFVIKYNDIKSLKKIQFDYLDNNYLIENLNPELDEIYNILEFLRIKNNLIFDWNLILNNNISVNNLFSFYNNLKHLNDKDITDIIIKFNNKEKEQEKITWLEF